MEKESKKVVTLSDLLSKIQKEASEKIGKELMETWTEPDFKEAIELSRYPRGEVNFYRALAALIMDIGPEKIGKALNRICTNSEKENAKIWENIESLNCLPAEWKKPVEVTNVETGEVTTKSLFSIVTYIQTLTTEKGKAKNERIPKNKNLLKFHQLKSAINLAYFTNQAKLLKAQIPSKFDDVDELLTQDIPSWSFDTTDMKLEVIG